MVSKLFDVQNGKVIPTEHCYVIKWLKDIMDKYEKDEEYLKVYAYLFYMTYPNPDAVPYFNIVAIDKEEVILKDIDGTFSTEDPLIFSALDRCKVMFSTPASRAYEGISGMLDKLALFMRTTNLTAGKDGNITQLVGAAKSFEQVRTSFKGAYKDLQDEQKSHVRGGKGIAYDQ